MANLAENPEYRQQIVEQKGIQALVASLKHHPRERSALERALKRRCIAEEGRAASLWLSLRMPPRSTAGAQVARCLVAGGRPSWRRGASSGLA